MYTVDPAWNNPERAFTQTKSQKRCLLKIMSYLKKTQAEVLRFVDRTS